MSSSAGFSYKQKVDGANLHLSLTGTIDEDAQMPPVTAGSFKNVMIDMSEIKSINSIGIREWLKWIQPIAENSKITFEKCPKAIVLQFNMVEGFLPSGANVLSFFVPYFCESCDREDNHLFTFGKDISVKAGNVNITFDLKANGKCAKSPCESEMDVSAAKYFQFLKKLA